MALTWIEDGDSRQATIVRKGKKATSSYVRSFKVFGTTDDVELHTAASAKIIADGYWEYPGLPSMKLRAEQYTVSFLGDNAWQVTIQYEKNGADDGNEPLKRARSFDTSGGSQHITQAYSESRFGANAPDQMMAIGVDSNGVNGVDIVVPALQWQETYDVPNQYITSGWIRGVAGVTGTTNLSAFRGFQRGEVLFVGCTGSQEWDDEKGKGPWSLAFRFVASQNQTGLSVGSIGGITKGGHQYLWVRYEDAVEGNDLLKRPKAVYVNQVYRETDFSVLGIGTS
jgi:hypothetical protein